VHYCPSGWRSISVPAGQIADPLVICGNDRVPEGGWYLLMQQKTV
jgi:hypothetical protein